LSQADQYRVTFNFDEAVYVVAFEGFRTSANRCPASSVSGASR
jgi:hypothetical protein